MMRSFPVSTSMSVAVSLTDDGMFGMITKRDKAVFVYRYKARRACSLINTNFLTEHFRLLMRAFTCYIL